MIKLFARLFITNYQQIAAPEVRRAYGVLCSIVGISINIVLFVIKYLAGSISGSVAIIADAFNNLSDAGSSLITLIGFKFAGRKPDPGHPFGHGRFEYISGLVVAGAIILMGVEIAKTSFAKIINPTSVEFSWLVIVILQISILAKTYMYIYNNRIGKRIDSAGMRATALDSLSDMVATTVVLISTLISHFTPLNVDGWCGMLVSLFILFAGYKAAKETISPLLGQAPAPELINRIEELALSYPEIIGLHDLVVHDYGPGRLMISLHAEVPGNGDIYHLHDVIDQAENLLAGELNCEAVIHMDPVCVDDEQINELRYQIAELAHSLDHAATIHDFRIVKGPSHTNLIFDLVLPHESKLSPEQARQEMEKLVESKCQNCFLVMKIDRPYA